MLEIAENKLGNAGIKYYNTASRNISFDNEFDVVTAVQSYHYLNIETRKTAIKYCFKALNKSGIIVTFENIAMSEFRSESMSIERWKNFLASGGKTQEEIQSHINRRGTVVFPITIMQHINMLQECGFNSVDILWSSYMQAGFFAVK